MTEARIEIVRGDITKQEVDAIVNAANSGLMGGGGVDGAIHRAGGPDILKECKEIVDRDGRLPPGEAVITTGGNLPARFVIHTVGPRWSGGSHGEEGLLRNAHLNSLKLATEKSLKSVAFPAISTGAYGYPYKEAAVTAITAALDFLENTENRLELVRFVLFDREIRDAYAAELIRRLNS